jgi:hypothetical protein
LRGAISRHFRPANRYTADANEDGMAAMPCDASGGKRGRFTAAARLPRREVGRPMGACRAREAQHTSGRVVRPPHRISLVAGV